MMGSRHSEGTGRALRSPAGQWQRQGPAWGPPVTLDHSACCCPLGTQQMLALVVGHQECGVGWSSSRGQLGGRVGCCGWGWVRKGPVSCTRFKNLSGAQGAPGVT